MWYSCANLILTPGHETLNIPRMCEAVVSLNDVLSNWLQAQTNFDISFFALGRIEDFPINSTFEPVGLLIHLYLSVNCRKT